MAKIGNPNRLGSEDLDWRGAFVYVFVACTTLGGVCLIAGLSPNAVLWQQIAFGFASVAMFTLAIVFTVVAFRRMKEEALVRDGGESGPIESSEDALLEED